MFSILTSKKSFNDPWIGHSGLNKSGLHAKRMKSAAFCASARKAQVSYRAGKWREQLDRDGFVIIRDFLSADDFARLYDEVASKAEEVREKTPYQINTKRGFGAPIRHDWGYDRFDGGTLNRFIEIDEKTMPEAHRFTLEPRLQQLCRAVVGLPLRSTNVRVYELVHGDEAANHDIQKDFHRDTFFTAMKFWYFLDPVTEDDGPFIYVPESHRLTPARMNWETDQAENITGPEGRNKPNSGGSFRISYEEIKKMGLPEPVKCVVPGNTFVIADTLGFHRRGDAKTGTSRLSIYSSNRPWPFFPFGA